MLSLSLQRAETGVRETLPSRLLTSIRIRTAIPFRLASLLVDGIASFAP
jgi:hypothetical protein